MNHDDFSAQFRAPRAAKRQGAFFECGEYGDDDCYELEGSTDILIGPDGFAYLCLGHEDDLPDTETCNP